MSLPWIRIDSDIYAHDKVLQLLSTAHGKSAFAVYICSIAWSAGQGTDGHIPTVALPVIHGTPRDVTALVRVGLWDKDPKNGWLIHNYAGRQRLAQIEKMAELGRRGAKARWAGTDSATP